MTLERVRGSDLVVQRQFRDIDACPSAEKDEASDRRGVSFGLVVFLLGFLIGPPKNRRKGREDFDGRGIATCLLCQSADVVNLRPKNLGAVA